MKPLYKSVLKDMTQRNFDFQYSFVILNIATPGAIIPLKCTLYTGQGVSNKQILREVNNFMI